MNPRIACLALLLLTLTACGQSGKLVLPDKNVAPPKAAETKATVVPAIPDGTTDTAPATPAQEAPDASKKVTQ